MYSCCEEKQFFLANQYQQAMSGNNFWSGILGSLVGIGAFQTCGPNDEGWYDYCTYPAPPNALCQFKIELDNGQEVSEKWIGYSRDFRPEFNVAYLKWRYTGIARQERGL